MELQKYTRSKSDWDKQFLREPYKQPCSIALFLFEGKKRGERERGGRESSKAAKTHLLTQANAFHTARGAERRKEALMNSRHKHCTADTSLCNFYLANILGANHAKVTKTWDKIPTEEPLQKNGLRCFPLFFLLNMGLLYFACDEEI